MAIRKVYNKNFFKTWSRDMAYFLGFFCADGNMVKNKRGGCYISIYSADKNIVLDLQNTIGSKHKLSSVKSETGVTYRFQIGSTELYKDLCILGITPDKTSRMKLPKMPKQYEPDFIRGYFDGDGNVWTGVVKRKVTKDGYKMLVGFTSASKGFLSHLSFILKERGISGGSLFNIKNKNCSRLSLSTLDALKLYKIMYNKPHKLFLRRKKLVFEKFIKMRW